MNNSDDSLNDNRKKLKMKSVNIELGELTQHNLKQLKVLHRDIFPVSYNEKFYKDLLNAEELCKLGKILMLRLILSMKFQHIVMILSLVLFVVVLIYQIITVDYT
jgi:hypothetical protein